jgi:flagellar hook-associated protein 2
MAGMSLSTGLISGMDTGTLISQLMQVEANPQTLLKTKLTATQADAAAYRAVNTRFDALRTAAEALTASTAWSTTKASSSVPAAVTATAGSSALPGSLTFTVSQLATTHSLIGPALTSTVPSTPTVPATAADVAFGATITVTPKGQAAQTFDVGGTGSLADAVTAINKNTALGLTATVMQVADGTFRLQVSAGGSGEARSFSLTTDTGHTFTPLVTGQDAELTLGAAPNSFSVTSATNTFTGLLPDTTITVSKAATDTPVTVDVASDPDAVAAKVSALISAANGVLSTVTSYTSASSATATLKGDSTLRELASQILGAVSYAVGGNGSAAVAGLQLNKDGTIAFDAATFTEKLKSDPELVQRLFQDTPAGVDADGNAVAAVTGIAGRLQAIGKNASDTTTGTLTLMAKSEDSQATDLEARIADWDLRLALRKDSLTRQFTAMETALGTLQNQSTWLTGQLSALPSWSQSDK